MPVRRDSIGWTQMKRNLASDGKSTELQHSAFPVGLDMIEVLTRFWGELDQILPARIIHVVDPYFLDAGGESTYTHAGNVASLLRPALRTAEEIRLIHSRQREGVTAATEECFLRVNPDIDIVFHRGTQMHARYVIADHTRVLRMEFSFNRIRKSFGTVSVVSDPSDLEGILGELRRLEERSGS